MVRNSVQRVGAGRDRSTAASAGDPTVKLEEELVRLQKEKERREKALLRKQSAPRAGRTGGLGTRAERPSEGERRTAAKRPVVGRSSKSPSAAG
jgi:hypothetical protein